MTMLCNSDRILAIDVGAGTQDILIYDPERQPENCVKLVLPSQTQVVAGRIRRATERRRPLYLTGTLMGGGASSAAIQDHLAAGLPVFAAEEPARTLHNDLERVSAMGVHLCADPPAGAEVVHLGDVDLDAIAAALLCFEIPLPAHHAVAVQDHGYLPGSGGREYRYEYLQSLMQRGGRLVDMVFREPPAPMIRMQAVRRLLPDAIVMDTGAAAVLGTLEDPVVARAASSEGAVLVNVGNLHTFGVAVRDGRIFGLFEHHTGGITRENLSRLVERLRTGMLTDDEVRSLGGHGAAFDPAYRDQPEIAFVAITGPNRALARGLGYYEAVPHGDMMLAGPWGLVAGVRSLS